MCVLCVCYIHRNNIIIWAIHQLSKHLRQGSKPILVCRDTWRKRAIFGYAAQCQKKRLFVNSSFWFTNVSTRLMILENEFETDVTKKLWNLFNFQFRKWVGGEKSIEWTLFQRLLMDVWNVSGSVRLKIQHLIGQSWTICNPLTEHSWQHGPCQG